MEFDNLINKWQASQEMANKKITLNKTSLDGLLAQKVQSSLKPVFWQRRIELGFHGLAIIILLVFMVAAWPQVQYVLSGLVLLGFYVFLAINCIRQLIDIKQIDYTNDITSAQSALMKIQSHLLTFMRLSVLFIPVFLSYPVVVGKAFAMLKLGFWENFDINQNANGQWWVVQILVYVVLIPLGIWFYNQVQYKNLHKPWVARIIKQSSSKRVASAQQFLNEIKAS